MRLGTSLETRQPMGSEPLDEAGLIKLALALGATSVGGTLSTAEKELVRRGRDHRPLQARIIEWARTAIVEGGDPLGEAMTTLRQPATRRPQGQFWTPRPIIARMLDWALAFAPRYLVDPGCGSGRFSIAALRRDPDLEVWSIDLDPLATLLTRAGLAAVDARTARVLNADYLEVDLKLGEGRAAWVGNPPYVRHHDLDPTTKSWAAAAAAGLGIRISGLAGLHALFFVATALKARSGDVGTFVTSAEWLDVGYGAAIRQLFLDGLGGHSLDMIDPRAAPFDDAMTTALISCFVKEQGPTAVAFRSWASVPDLGPLGRGRRLPSARLGAAPRWSRLLTSADDDVVTPPTLGSIARVHRGFVTGANDFFLLTAAEANARGLCRWCRPAITDAVEILDSGGVVRSDRERRLVFDLPADIDRSAHPRVDAYLAEGEDRGLDRRYIPAHRRPWWRLGIGPPPPIVASYMARRPPGFALNPDGMPLVNIGHGVYPRLTQETERLARIVEALNGARADYVGAGRTYHGGLEKFEPREMEALPLPRSLWFDVDAALP